uniref:Retinoic acid induced 1 n=1 Tax=Nothobranchius kadleci TaxID=1051664 RepID=A0A1A8CCX1_NOTKA
MNYLAWRPTGSTHTIPTPSTLTRGLVRIQAQAQGTTGQAIRPIHWQTRLTCLQPVEQESEDPKTVTASKLTLVTKSHLHYSQHSPSPSSYMEKCSPMPHCYKGYNMPPNSQYGRQMSSHGGLKQGAYRSPQNSYGYQQANPRGFEQQPPLQTMTNPQEPLSKYQHFNQPQQSYCLSELPVRSPEQYYQTCSPSSSHSPARSVGRSPSYSSTPSPLMTNPESFQYGQPPMTPGAASSSSSSSAGLQEQASANTMLMPPRSHPSPNIPHATPHSYTTTPQVPTMKERFSEKLLSNPSLWSLNALTSQVENISNNVQQLLLSEALVANKKGSKRSSGGSNSSGGSGVSSKKGDEYKSPPYPDSCSNLGGGPIQDPYSTPQHQSLPMELHEGGYSSSSDEPLDRGYYYFGQGRSPAQAHNNTQLSLDTASSCSIASPDDMSTRSGDSGLHNLTPDPTRCQIGQGGDSMGTPVKSLTDEMSPKCITIPSPMKQERDSPSDMQHISQSIKENFEESAWTEKLAEKEEMTTVKALDCASDGNMINPTEKQEKWSDEEKCPDVYCKVNTEMTEKSYCYDETVYREGHGKYDSDARDSIEQSPAALSDSSNKEHFGQELKSEAFKSESPTASESSVKTLPFTSRGDLEQDQYSTEKDESSENTSPTPQVDVLEDSSSDKRESRDQENEEGGKEEIREKVVEEEHFKIQKKLKACLYPLVSEEVREESEEGEKETQSLAQEHINNRDNLENCSADLCSRTENQSCVLSADGDFAGAPSHLNAAAATTAAGASARESAIGDTAPQSQSATPVFSALNDKAAPPGQTRDHIDHSDAKVLEPDSPQLPGKSILPSAPSWADTPPSPKKGDEDVEPGISCASAMTPLAKPEPVAPSAQPRAFGRKHTRGRRRITQSVVGIRRQLSLERGGEKEDDLMTQKTCMPSSKTALISDQTSLVHQESIVGQTPKMPADAFQSRMCTRSFNAPDMPPKADLNVKRKPGPKLGAKPGPKPGSKLGATPGPKARAKPGSRPGPKPNLKPGPKLTPKPGQKPVPNDSELPPKIEIIVKRKPGPKAGLKPVPKPAAKSGQKPGPKPAEGLSSIDTTPIKASVGRPRGSICKAKPANQENTNQQFTEVQSRSRKNLKPTMSQKSLDVKPVEQEAKEAPPEVKVPEKESKNMVLRSRKPSQEKMSKGKEKTVGEEIQTPTLTDVKVCDLSPNVEEVVSEDQNLTLSPDADKTTDDSPPTLPVQSKETKVKILPPVKRKSSPEPSTIQVKRKRGPKPKPKTLPPQPSLQEQIVPTDKSVRGTRRRRGPPKKIPVVTPITKGTAPYISGPSTISEVNVVAPTKTKVLPPRKGRGQKYEAMVQKIASPSLKKHILTPQQDISSNDDVAAKALSEIVLKEGETSAQISGAEMGECAKDGEEHHGEAVKNETSQESEKHEVSQEAPAQEVEGERVEKKVEQANGTSQEKFKPKTQQDCVHDKVCTSVETPSEAEASDEKTEQASEIVSTLATKCARTKRKRWAMVESTDASVVALEADSLIITTPRLAKQRAIKNNHEMHLKQRRKKRKGEAPLEVTETVEEANNETAESQDTVEETVINTEPTIPPPIIQDEVLETPQVVSTELIQKPRRGRKPSANPSKKKRSKPSTEHILGKPVRVHKKPGPKPGMKDAIEVIEAVVRAAGCEQQQKEEREKEERERTEKETDENQETCVVGPVVTVTEKQNELISVKRIRRKPIYQSSKLSFCPYVRINNSRDFSSWCAIVNKPEDTVVFQRRRKKGILRMRNPFTVAKVVPHTAAMLLGPMVNTNLIGRCLTCSLCGKPANYKDLGDLCGPYYAEDSIPRKALTIPHAQSFREESDKSNRDDSSVSEVPGTSSNSEGATNSEKEETTEASSQGASSSKHHHWRYRRLERPERLCQEGRPRRLTLRERFRRMKQLQTISTEASRDEEGNESKLQRLQMEVEAEEHWVHENCAIWTKGIVMVAARLYGLKEAASKSAQMSCYKCQIAGASLSCCWRGCSYKYHYVCAKEIGCTFHEDDFSIKCPKHEDL